MQTYNPSYKLTHTDTRGNTLTMEFTDPLFMSDVLAKFELFLRGITFCPNGKLEWVPTNEETEGYGDDLEDDVRFV